MNMDNVGKLLARPRLYNKTYRGKVPQTLLCLTGAGRKAFEQYRRKLKEAL
jgi:hypothetical protein